MKKSILLLPVFIYNTLIAQNPIVPPGVYMADPAAQVWNDGRLYLYCSVDESVNWYCSRKYHVLSTGDMDHWKLHENSFASDGPGDEVPYNDNLLFAPDCMFRNGKYYLYYCQPDRENAEGVAVSKKPTGPFRRGRPMDVGGYNQIDPGVFIDDDGQAYYIWGQFTLKMSKLRPDMLELEKGSIRDSVLTEQEHFFHEGAYMTKRNGLYYLVYADMSRNQAPTCIGYATSKNPMGPYKYRGVIIDNDQSDPQCWNNHGSIAAYGDQWYVFYHRSTHNSRKMRKACVEPIFFDENGSIPEVEMTSQGAGDPLSATEKIDAARACWMFGNVRIEQVAASNEALCKTRHNDRAVIRYVDFGKGGIDKVTLKVRPGNVNGTIQLKPDYPWRGSIASVNIEASAEENPEWITLTADVSDIDGIHALWIQFYGDAGSGELGCDLDEIVFHIDP